MREIVTVQLGRRANYLSTHFWNTQESYQTFAPDPPSPVNHDIHFRQGSGPDGSETYLPRTVIYDFKPEFGSLAKINALGALADKEEANSLWEGRVTRLNPAPPHEPSPYTHSLINATETVLPTPATTRYFADFATTYYHPRSLLPLSLPPSPVASSGDSTNEVASPGSDYSSRFSTFEVGVDLFTQRDAEVDIFDEDIRLWIEECDELQAVQLFTSSDDAWTGFCSKYLERLRDELGKCCLWVWGVDSSVDASVNRANGRKSRIQKQESLINAALAVSNFSEQASLFVPLALPTNLPSDIRLDRHALWHTSGLLAAAVESATIHTRLKEVGERVPTVQNWQDALSSGGRRTIATLAIDHNNIFEDTMNKSKDTRMENSNVLEDEDAAAAMENLPINLSPAIDNSASTVRRPLRDRVFARIDGLRSEAEVYEQFITKEVQPAKGGLLLERYFAPIDYPLLPTFPPIIAEAQAHAKAMPFRTSLTTSTSIPNWVRSLGSRIKAGAGGRLAGEEKESLVNDLGIIAETYIEDWNSADEEEEED